MNEQARTCPELIEEISVLKRRIKVLEQSESERKQAEEALRASEERYRRITEGITDYQYTVCIEKGRAVETKHSPVCIAVTGYTSEEFVAHDRVAVDRAHAPVHQRVQVRDVHAIVVRRPGDFEPRLAQGIQHLVGSWS